MSISITFFEPVFEHTHVFKLSGDSDNIVHHVTIHSKNSPDDKVNISFHLLNDRQRQLVYELFGNVTHSDETKGVTEMEEAETI